MPPSQLRDAPWYETAFDRSYLRIYPHRDQAEAERYAANLIRWLGVRSGQRVLDVACGEGRYARALARRGLRVTGVDLSQDLLEEARARGKLLPGAPLYFRRDIRKLPFSMQFEGALSMFTSFGYFETREDDLAIFRGIHRALLPGGRLVVDFLNEAQIRSSLVAEETRDLPTMRVATSRSIDEDAPGGPRVKKRVEGFDHATGLSVLDVQESVRLYTDEEVDALLTDAGLAPVGEPSGDLDGSPHDALSPRYVRVAEKPRS